MEDKKGFSLVELLVVIGIISVLIALLMPALSTAREAANRVKCLSTLRSMAQAAHSHAAEHRGYMPAAGNQSPTEKGVFATPEGLQDPLRRKYMYFFDNANDRWRPLPLPAALGHYMGLRIELDGVNDLMRLGRAMETDTMYYPFACPSKAREDINPGSTLSDGGSWYGPDVRMGYLLNGGVLARIAFPWGETPAGLLSRVRRPAEVFLFADGNTLNRHYAYGIQPSTSAHDTIEVCASKTQYDFPRHRGRINVVFVDGHAETLRLPRGDLGIEPGNFGDLQRIGVTKGVFD